MNNLIPWLLILKSVTQLATGEQAFFHLFIDIKLQTTYAHVVLTTPTQGYCVKRHMTQYIGHMMS